MMKICANDGADFFLFRAVRQDFTRIYGQKAVFGAFVRNRHFPGGPITDKESIFSDVSVILTNSVLRIICSIAASDLGYGQNVDF